MFLGHVISTKDININPKVEVVLNKNRPFNMMNIHSLLSLSRHYDWFIEGFALITASMKHLTYKRVKFEWNERCEKRF